MSDIYCAIRPYVSVSKLYGIANFDVSASSIGRLKPTDFGLLVLALLINFLTVYLGFNMTMIQGSWDNRISLVGDLVMIAIMPGINCASMAISVFNSEKILQMLHLIEDIHQQMKTFNIAQEYGKYRHVQIAFLTVSFATNFSFNLFYFVIYRSISLEINDMAFFVLGVYSPHATIVLVGQFLLVLMLGRGNFRQINLLFR
jgi:hypothetical protein